MATLSCKLEAKPEPPWVAGEVVLFTATVTLNGAPAAGAYVLFTGGGEAFSLREERIAGTDGKAAIVVTMPKPTLPAIEIYVSAIAKYPWPAHVYTAYSNTITGRVRSEITARVTLSVSPSPPWSYQQPITLTAQVTDARTGQPIPGRTVVFYAGTAGTYGRIGSGTTGSDGRCSITWTINITGTVTIYCIETATNQESNKVTGEVPAPPPPKPPVYKMEVSVSKTEVDPGETITVSGTLYQDSYPLPNYDVKVAPSWTGTISLKTDYQGKFSTKVTAPTSPGLYSIVVASVAGQKAFDIRVRKPITVLPTRITLIAISKAYSTLPVEIVGRLEYQDATGAWRPLAGQTVELIDLRYYKTLDSKATNSEGFFKVSWTFYTEGTYDCLLKYKGSDQYQASELKVTITVTKPPVDFGVFAEPPPDWYSSDYVRVYGHLKVEGQPIEDEVITCDLYVNNMYKSSLKAVKTKPDGTFVFAFISMNYAVGTVIEIRVTEKRWNTIKSITGRIVGEKRPGVIKPYKIELTVSPDPPWSVGQEITLTAKLTIDGTPVPRYPITILAYPPPLELPRPGETIGEGLTDGMGVFSIKHKIKTDYGPSHYNPVGDVITFTASIWDPGAQRTIFSNTIIGQVFVGVPPPVPKYKIVATIDKPKVAPGEKATIFGTAYIDTSPAPGYRVMLDYGYWVHKTDTDEAGRFSDTFVASSEMPAKTIVSVRLYDPKTRTLLAETTVEFELVPAPVPAPPAVPPAPPPPAPPTGKLYLIAKVSRGVLPMDLIINYFEHPTGKTTEAKKFELTATETKILLAEIPLVEGRVVVRGYIADKFGQKKEFEKTAVIAPPATYLTPVR